MPYILLPHTLCVSDPLKGNTLFMIANSGIKTAISASVPSGTYLRHVPRIYHYFEGVFL